MATKSTKRHENIETEHANMRVMSSRAFWGHLDIGFVDWITKSQCNGFRLSEHGI